MQTQSKTTTIPQINNQQGWKQKLAEDLGPATKVSICQHTNQTTLQQHPTTRISSPQVMQQQPTPYCKQTRPSSIQINTRQHTWQSNTHCLPCLPHIKHLNPHTSHQLAHTILNKSYYQSSINNPRTQNRSRVQHRSHKKQPPTRKRTRVTLHKQTKHNQKTNTNTTKLNQKPRWKTKHKAQNHPNNKTTIHKCKSKTQLKQTWQWHPNRPQTCISPKNKLIKHFFNTSCVSFQMSHLLLGYYSSITFNLYFFWTKNKFH